MIAKYPSSLQKESARLEARAESLRKRIGEAKLRAKPLLKKDPDRSQKLIMSVLGEVAVFHDEVKRLDQERVVFDEMRRDHKSEISYAKGVFRELDQYIARISEIGFRLPQDCEVDVLRERMEALVQSVNPQNTVLIPDYVKIVREAKQLAYEIRVVQAQIFTKTEGLHKTNGTRIRTCWRWYEKDLREHKERHERDLQILEENTPQEIWQDSGREYGEKVVTLLQLPSRIQVVEELNSMSVQKFDEAATALSQIENSEREFEVIARAPRTLLEKYQLAKEESQTRARQVANILEEAKAATGDSDAQGFGKADLEKALGKVRQAEELQRTNLPNWFSVITVLTMAFHAAQDAKESAQEHARQVEAARRRRREEEEEEQRRRNSYSSSYSSWSSGGFGGSSGGGFGGFSGGGGSFGGGGASGKW